MSYRALADIEVTFAAGHAGRGLALGGDRSAAGRWSMTEVRPQPGYVAAFVAAAPAAS